MRTRTWKKNCWRNRAIYIFRQRRNANRRNKRIFLCLSIWIVITGGIFMLVYVTNTNTEHAAQTTFSTMGSVLEFFNTDDGLQIKWCHGCNNRSQMQAGLEGNYHMLEGDINLRWYGYENQTNEPIMAHPPDVDSDNTLDNWLNSITERSDKGMKLDFKSLEVVRPSLEMLKSKQSGLGHPVWVNADVIRGPGREHEPPVINGTKFLEIVNEVFPSVTLSLGWTTTCCDKSFTRDMIHQMWQFCRNLNQPITFPARAALLKSSWEHFKWLLMQKPQNYSITVWTPAGREEWEGASIYDMLYVRNDCNKSLIYYDLPGQKLEEFKQLSITAGSLYNHFPMEHRDGLYVSWAHAVNSQEELSEALNGDVMMLEADVLLRNGTGVPVMAHPPATDSNIELGEWITKVIPSNKGIKLDFKSLEVLEPALKDLQMKKGAYQQPVWINADIFQGPNTDKPGVNATEFKRLVLKYFPESTLSVGWTTNWNNTAENDVYTEAMVNEMKQFCSDIVQPVTFPIRAAMAKRSWLALKMLLDQSASYTFTIWSSKSDEVDADDLLYVRQNAEPDRIYYDLPEPLMKAFLSKLNITTT